jgi:tRNA-Thr(GGU) m(6)t(6)A37 methyltransferase TsaA
MIESKIRFIGKIHSSLRRKQDCPLQENENAPPAELIIFPEFTAGIKNIVPGSDILLLTWLDKADRSILQCIPRNNFDSPMIGVFSTRSPDRPNPIGIHIVRVISVMDGCIVVSNLEVLDETPLIDIKPVLAKDGIQT